MKIPPNHLELQAYVDGETKDSRTRDIEAWTADHTQGRQLIDSIRGLRRLLRDHETVRPVETTREHYWSRIEQVIQPDATVDPLDHWDWQKWLRWALPIGVVGTVLLGLFLFIDPGVHARIDSSYVLLATGHEMEMLIPDTTWMSFRSENEGMTVIWLDTGPESILPGP